MKSFKQYIIEMAFETPKMQNDDYDSFVDELKDWAIKANKLCWKYKEQKIIWRGVKIKSGYGVVTLATNKDRIGYMGKMLPQVDAHIKNLQKIFKIGIPIFAIRNKILASLFGKTYAFLPNSDFRCLWSEQVSDSAHLKEDMLTKELYESYQQNDNSLPPNDFTNEIIFICDDYYLVDVDKLLKDTRSKKPLETYEDLAKLLYHWSKK